MKQFRLRHLRLRKLGLLLLATTVVPTWANETPVAPPVAEQAACELTLQSSTQRQITPSRPPSSKLAIEERAEKAWKGNFRDKQSFFAKVHSEMYYLFPGREQELDRLLSAVKMVALFPTLVKKPIVVDLVGFPGDGKTSMVKEASRLLGLGKRFHQEDVKQDQIGIGLEVYRNLQDVRADSGEPTVSMLAIDEYQNFRMHEKFIEADGASDADAEAARAMSIVNATRANWVRLLYSIYGNGSEQTPPAVDLSLMVRQLRSDVDNLLKIRDSISKSLDKTIELRQVLADASQTQELRSNAEAKIFELNREAPQWTDALRAQERKLKASLKLLLDSYGNFFPTFDILSRSALVEHVMANTASFFDTLELAMETSGTFHSEHTYLQMITVVLGNPEKIIKDIRRQTRGKALTADQFRDLVKNIDPNEVREVMWDRIFGADNPGLRQRFNVDQWQIMLPLSDASWGFFVDRQLEIMEYEFAASMEAAGLKGVELKIDSTVRQMLLNEARISTEGARVYFERATSLIGNFFSDMASRIVEVQPTLNPTRVQWKFDASRREFVIMARDRNDGLVLNERASVRSLNRNEANSKINDYDKKRLLANKAGEIVLGMSLFGSLPLTFTLEPEQATDWALADLWSAPEKERHTSIANFVRVAMASSSAQNLLVDGFVPLSEPAVKFSADLVRRMIDDMQRREQQYAFLISLDANGRRVHGEGFPMPHGLSQPAIDALLEAVGARSSVENGAAENAAIEKILRILHSEVKTLIGQNAELISALARMMDTRLAQAGGNGSLVEIQSEDIMKVVAETQTRYMYKPTTWNKIFRRSALNTRFMVTAKTLTNEPGASPQRNHELFNPPPPHGGRGVWGRLWAKVFGRPYSQRQFGGN